MARYLSRIAASSTDTKTRQLLLQRNREQRASSLRAHVTKHVLMCAYRQRQCTVRAGWVAGRSSLTDDRKCWWSDTAAEVITTCHQFTHYRPDHLSPRLFRASPATPTPGASPQTNPLEIIKTTHGRAAAVGPSR